jgi:nucleotide-binding universal stress UspA family protein
MKVVLAVDFSVPSEVAVSEVMARPWPSGTSVHILHVVDLFALTNSVGYFDTFINKETDEASALGIAVAQRLQSRGLETNLKVIEGYPGTGIVDYAEQCGADLILVGSQGHSGIARLLLGSVAKMVLQNAHCSVEVVRATSRSNGMKVLLATDGSDYSIAAAESVAERPWPDGSEFKIVSIVDLVIPANDPWYAAGEVIDRLREENTKSSQEAVDAAQRILNDARLTSTPQVLMGSPKWRIVDEAKEWGANLVVLGSHGRRGMTRLLLGSVSEAVALHAHCSVEVIRNRALINK